MTTNVYTQESIIEKLNELRESGWIESCRNGNCGGIGNTLEEFLGIKENNLRLPDAAEWELKTQRLNTKSPVTLFHVEPSPTTVKFIPCVLLPKYGWPHKKAGMKYPSNEVSFRQTISTSRRSDRGFKVVVDRQAEKILISFDPNSVASRHKDWIESVEKRVGLGELDPQPYWNFQDLYYKTREKLNNCFFVIANAKLIEGKEFFKYEKIYKLSHFSFEKFIDTIEQGEILVDFDARTGHNHGTKFRYKYRNSKIISLYENIEEI